MHNELLYITQITPSVSQPQSAPHPSVPQLLHLPLTNCKSANGAKTGLSVSGKISVCVSSGTISISVCFPLLYVSYMLIKRKSQHVDATNAAPTSSSRIQEFSPRRLARAICHCTGASAVISGLYPLFSLFAFARSLELKCSRTRLTFAGGREYCLTSARVASVLSMTYT